MRRVSRCPEGAPCLTARRFQRLPRASDGPRAQPFNRGLIKPRRGNRQTRQAFSLWQSINQAAKAAIRIIPPRAEGKPNPCIAQRIGKSGRRHIPGPFRQQREREACRALSPRCVKRRPTRPGPGKRDHRHGMILNQPGGQPIAGDLLNGQAKWRTHDAGSSQAALLGALGNTARAAAST